jgi:hypothetical protein
LTSLDRLVGPVVVPIAPGGKIHSTAGSALFCDRSYQKSRTERKRKSKPSVIGDA